MVVSILFHGDSYLLGFDLLVIFCGFYHGESSWNHHLGEYVLPFPGIEQANPTFWEDSHFDEYVSTGLEPLTKFILMSWTATKTSDGLSWFTSFLQDEDEDSEEEDDDDEDDDDDDDDDVPVKGKKYNPPARGKACGM